jgi:protein arginine kinase
MMFLPALERQRSISDFMRQWSECSLTVRGVFGEGSAAEGHRYQISNDKTLGLSEEEILGFMHSAVTQIVEAEERERKRWVSEDGIRLRDETMRAFGVLTNCYTLEYAEMQDLLTKVRLGLALGFVQVRGNDPYALDGLMDSMRPYSFCAKYDQMDATPLQRALKRAAVSRRKLPLIIEKV